MKGTRLFWQSILVVAFVVGVIAAVLPARRATKVDIIGAIATT